MSRGRIALAFIACATAACAESPMADIDCPFDTAPFKATHTADCARFAYRDGDTDIAFDIAILAPVAHATDRAILYIPGGPGDTPVSEYGPPPDLVTRFADRLFVTFNPRGTDGTEPRLACDLGPGIWNEDFTGQEARRIIHACRSDLPVTPQRPDLFSSRAIADDIDRFVRQMGLDRVGLFGVSYGTEAALHLAADAPDWLDFAILDSLSLPGLSGFEDELRARDRFLSALDETCFEDGACIDLVRGGGASLASWAAAFDETPLTFTLGPDDAPWSLDGAEMLDYLAGLGSYPDGLDIASALIGLLETNRLSALAWIRLDLTDTVEFAAESTPLSLQAYSDTYTMADREAVETPTVYATDRDGLSTLLDFYEIWSEGQPREAHFLATGRDAAPSPVPVLVLSGGLDSATPAEWANGLENRFTGLTRYIFPHLGHAVSFGTAAGMTNLDIRHEMLCAADAITAFTDQTASLPDDCTPYRVGDAL